MPHPNNQVNDALVRLLDELCMWERDTGRGSTVIIIPHNDDEDIVLAQDGKPILNDIVTPQRLLDIALRDRESCKRRRA